MIDKDKFKKRICHSPCRNGHIESCNIDAFKIDDDDGLAYHLGFSTNTLSKVDFFLENDGTIHLIELTDLENFIKELHGSLLTKLAYHENTKGKKLTSKEQKLIRKNEWKPITDEFIKKWSGSIAVIERLYRKTGIIEDDPSYKMLVVCKNETDIRMLDELKTRLEGTMGSVTISNTGKVNESIPL